MNNFKGYGNQDFESQLRIDDLVEEERIRFERRIAELAAKKKEIVKNQRNAVKLSNLSAQLKEVQQDNSLDKMEESPPSSSSTVLSSNVDIGAETGSNVEIEIKTENAGVNKVDEQANKEMQEDRVEPLSKKSGLCCRHPAVADLAGVSDIGSSAVLGGSAVGTHPISAAAEGDIRRVEDAGTPGNSGRRTRSSSLDRNSQSLKLDWYNETGNPNEL